MGFEPQKFFVGLMDFFSILLPGALLTFLVINRVEPRVLESVGGQLSGPQGWIAFLFASYLLGHMVFLLGSWLDEFYNRVRGYTLNKQIKRFVRRGRPLSWPLRALVWLVFKGERDIAVNRADRIKRRALDGLHARGAVNVFQWSKALLNVESPQSLAVVQRFEADSKFFRCLAVVLLIVLATWSLPERPWPLGAIPVVVALLLLALWRYMEQRLKATNQAYWSVITLTAREGKVTFDKPPPVAGPERAGGVVFRRRWGKARYLLVEAKEDPTQWVLPKGHVEDGERHPETAVREVLEETGVWARILGDLRDVSYSVNGEAITVRMFLMQAVGRGFRKDVDRRHVWLPLEQAERKATHLATRELLQAAEQRRVRA